MNSRGLHVFFGVAVAVQAPLHLQRVLLPGERHLVHPAVAALAADALVDVNAVVEVDEVGQIVDARPAIDLPVRKLARTGSSVGLVLQICEWQFMQVLVGGMLAKLEVSTVVWQYRQSMPRPPTWCAWLNGTGCSRGCVRARVVVASGPAR